MTCQNIDITVSPCGWYIPGGLCKRDDTFRCIEYVLSNEMEVSYSGLRNYVECPYKYYLSTIRGLQLIRPPVRMLAGKIMSECLDVIHSSKPTKSYQDVLSYYKDIYSDPDDPDKVVSEVCKIDGLLRAYTESPLSEEKGITQYEFKWREPEYPVIHGYMDLVRQVDGVGGYGYEFKYSTHDNWTRFVVAGQLSTYFLGSSLERICLRVFKVPGIKPKRGEKPVEFTERVYDDVSGSIKSYVTDVNYWRNEFDLNGVKDKYRVIANEVYARLNQGEGSFYKTENQDSHFRCEYLPICESGVVSDQLYTKRGVVR